MNILHPPQNNVPLNISFMAKLSNLAYQPASIIRHGLSELGIGYETELEFIEGQKQATQGFALNLDTDIIICFRGTEPHELIDWLTDLNFQQTPVELLGVKGMVHGGFWLALDAVWPHIKKWLKAKGPDKKIWLTGHSLGGALANLTMLRLLAENFLGSINGLYTYGCPRSVNSSLAVKLNDLCKEKIFRVVNHNDIVPHVPPESRYIPALDFCHFGSRVFFAENEQLWMDKNTALWENSKQQKEKMILGIINKVFDGLNLPEMIDDHSRENYIRLSEICAKQILTEEPLAKS